MSKVKLRKSLVLCTLVVLSLLAGCKDSEYSRREEVKETVHYYGPQSQPLTATVRWQKNDSDLMQSVCAHSSLRELNLLTTTRDGSPILPFVAKLQNLKTLNVIETPLSDDELVALSEAKGLTSLELSRTGISGQGLQYLAKLPLKRLVVRERQLSKEGLNAIANMTELEELELCIPCAHWADMPTLASNKTLKSVTITDGYFSYREFGGLKCLLGATNLKSLHLSGANLNDRTLKSIGTLSNLRNLTIEQCVVSQDGIEQLMKLGRLKSVDIAALKLLQDKPGIRLVEFADDEMLPLPIRG